MLTRIYVCDHQGLPEELDLDLNGCGEKDVRRLQWQYGKLKLQWRSLLTAQQEQAKLTGKASDTACPVNFICCLKW